MEKKTLIRDFDLAMVIKKSNIYTYICTYTHAPLLSVNSGGGHMLSLCSGQSLAEQTHDYGSFLTRLMHLHKGFLILSKGQLPIAG